VNELVSSRRWGTDSVNRRFVHRRWASVNWLGTAQRNSLREWTRIGNLTWSLEMSSFTRISDLIYIDGSMAMIMQLWFQPHYPGSNPSHNAYPDAYPDTATILIQDIKHCWDSWYKYTCNNQSYNTEVGENHVHIFYGAISVCRSNGPR
jgi:hypothetical protein